MFVQNVVFVIFCKKSHMGFGHMVDVMVWLDKELVAHI